jgi:hypothetical protein
MSNLTPPRRLVNLYIVTAHVSLACAFLLTAWNPAAVAGFFYHARIVAVVHLITIGWIAMSILGMSYVVLPFACGVAFPPRRSDYAAYALLLIGLIGMVAHFWIGEFGGMAWSAATAALGILYVVTRLAFAIRRAKVAQGVKLHLYLAALNAAGAVAMGVLLGFDKVRSFLPGYVLSNVFAHAHLAAIGWVSMTMMGFGYRLLPMVLPSAMPSGRSLYASAIVLEIGIVGLFASLVMRAGTTPLFALLIIGAIATFGTHVIWMLSHPRRPPPERTRGDFAVHHLAAAGACLVLASVCGLLLAALPMSDATMRLALLYGVFGLLGFLAQAIVGFERRILPVAWNYWAVQNTGRALGSLQRRVPPGFTFFAWGGGVPLLGAGFFVNSTAFVAAGAWLLVAASLVMLTDVVLQPVRKISTSAEISDTIERPRSDCSPSAPLRERYASCLSIEHHDHV